MKRAHRNIIHIIGSLLLMIPLAGGCMQAPRQGEPGGEAPDVITVWYSLSGAEATALRTAMADQLKSHPEVIVKLKYVAEEDFASLAYQAEAGGQGPQIFLTSRTVLYQMHKQGSLAAVAETGSKTFPAAAAEFRFGGTAYAQPWLTNIPVLYYRKDAVQTPPTDLAELLNNGAVLTTPNTETLASFWLAQGGGLWNGSGPTLNKAENLAFVQQLASWIQNGQLRVDPNATILFAGGQANYMIGPAGWAGSLSKQGVPWASVPVSNLAAPEKRELLGETLGIANSTVKSQDAMLPSIQLVERLLLSTDVEGAVEKAGGRLPDNPDFYQTAVGAPFAPLSQALSDGWALEGDAPEWLLIPIQDEAWTNVINGAAADQALNNAQSAAQTALGGAP